MDLDTRHVRALLAVVEEGTFTDAAIALGTSQASVSRSVQRLEAVLGGRLLERSARLVRLTDRGHDVLATCRRLVALVDDLAAPDGGAETVLGYSWGTLGEHTRQVQRDWEARRGTALVLVQTNTSSGGLLEGRCEVAVVRRPVRDVRVAHGLVGEESRYAALATDHPLAARPTVALADLVGETVAVDAATGTTAASLWGAGPAPAFRRTHALDEWLTLVASGRAVGISAAATVAQHPRPGVAYRLVEDAPMIEVRLAWWRDRPPEGLDDLLRVVRGAYAGGDVLGPRPPA